MNTFLLSRASADISVHLVIKKGWWNSGNGSVKKCLSNVFCGPRIRPHDEKAMDNLARYIVRTSFSQEKMTYVPQDSKVLYQSKDGKEEKVRVEGIPLPKFPLRLRRTALQTQSRPLALSQPARPFRHPGPHFTPASCGHNILRPELA
jgi:hypothetical protein